jgi:hypothetical protein
VEIFAREGQPLPLERQLSCTKSFNSGVFDEPSLLAQLSLGTGCTTGLIFYKEITMRNFKNLFVLMLLLGSLTGLQACDSNDGPLEDAGEAIDDAADDVGDAVEEACEDATDSNCD